jgi:hypothetical protein
VLIAILSSNLRSQTQIQIVKYLLSIFFFLLAACVYSQSLSEEEKFLLTVKQTNNPPDGLLSGRSTFLFSQDYTDAELQQIQKAFQQTGIDVVNYHESETVMAGVDLRNAYVIRFTRRDIKFLIFGRKEKQDYLFTFLMFNPRSGLSHPGQSAWSVHAANLHDLLLNIFRTLTSTQKRQNFLINDLPEQENIGNIFVNVRNESQVSSLKNFKIAVPKLGDKTSDPLLIQFLKDNLNMPYEVVEDSLQTKDLLKKNFRYVLHYVHAPGVVAKEILGYDMTKSENALASVTYPGRSLQLKTIPSKSVIFKFYLKDLEDGNMYFGTKWDADITWQDALRNHLDAYRMTGRL